MTAVRILFYINIKFTSLFLVDKADLHWTRKLERCWKKFQNEFIRRFLHEFLRLDWKDGRQQKAKERKYKPPKCDFLEKWKKRKQRCIK